jgi:hypothetical protein
MVYASFTSTSQTSFHTSPQASIIVSTSSRPPSPARTAIPPPPAQPDTPRARREAEAAATAAAIAGEAWWETYYEEVDGELRRKTPQRSLSFFTAFFAAIFRAVGGTLACIFCTQRWLRIAAWSAVTLFIPAAESVLVWCASAEGIPTTCAPGEAGALVEVQCPKCATSIEAWVRISAIPAASEAQRLRAIRDEARGAAIAARQKRKVRFGLSAKDLSLLDIYEEEAGFQESESGNQYGGLHAVERYAALFMAIHLLDRIVATLRSTCADARAPLPTLAIFLFSTVLSLTVPRSPYALGEEGRVARLLLDFVGIGWVIRAYAAVHRQDLVDLLNGVEVEAKRIAAL